MPKPRHARRPHRREELPEDDEAEEAAEERRLSDAETDVLVEDLVGSTAEVPEDWRDALDQRLSSLLNVERLKGEADKKTLDEVFDKSTLLTLWKMISNGVFQTLDYPISTGKEANVFHATTRDDDALAVKIFRTNTATFRSFMTYIEGDPRFGNVGHDRREIVHVWAQKEYKNLQRYFEAGVRVPQPIAHRQNVLVMEFVGKDGTPAPLLKDAPPEDPAAAYATLVENYRKGVAAGLVHGDFSEYNVLNLDGDLFVIDVAQAVLSRHPMARELLARDARNLARYFRKLGVKTTEEATFAALRPAEKLKTESGVKGEGSS